MDNEVKIQFKNSITGETKLEKYKQTLTQIYSVVNEMQKGGTKELETSSAYTIQISKDVNDMAKRNKAAFSYTTLRTFTRGLQNLTKAMASNIAQSSTYYENLNLLRVAFKGDIVEAEKFVNKLSEMYGLDESWGYRTVGIFKQLSNAMGLANDIGTKLSTTMTQFAIDVSSLYNVDTNDAVSILTSALAGQTKPARRLGADITQSTLQQTLNQQGIQKSISDLTYAEKRLVIVTSLLKQVEEATDDWGKTMSSPANQTRILSEQWDRLTRTLGNIFLPIVYKILPYVNAILMVLTEIAQIIADIMAKLLGFKPEDLNFGAGVSAEVEDFTENMNAASDSVDNLKDKMSGLRSFDKLINIPTPKSTGASGISGTGVSADILNMANNAMDEYNNKLTNAKNRAAEIRDNIMEWLGFTKEVDEETGEVSFKFDHITSGTVLGALAVGGSIFTGVMKIYNVLSKFGLLKFSNLTGLTKIFSGGSASSLLSGITTALPIILIVAGEIQAILTDKDLQKQIERLKDNFIKLKETLQPLADKILPVLKDLFEKVSKAFKETISQEWQKFVDLLGTLSEISLSAINTGIEVFIDLVNGDFSSAKDKWLQHWDTMKNSIIDFANTFKDQLGKVDVEKVKENMKSVIDWFDDLPEKAGKKAGDIAAKLVSKLGEYFDDEENQKKLLDIGKKIIGFIVSGMVGGINAMINIPSLIKDKLVKQLNENESDKGSKSFLDVGKSILESIIKGMINPIATMIPKFVTNFYDTLEKELEKSGKGKTISVGITAGKSAFGFGGNILGALFKANGGVYSGGKWHDIQRYDGGGMPQTGQLFWARENGLPEMVGQIGGHTAVMNNTQIVGSVANGVYRAVKEANAQTQTSNSGIRQVDIYLDKNHKLASYTLEELQSMAKSNGKSISIS